MKVRQCRRCNKLFQDLGSPICPACVQEVDKQFDAVRNYIYDHPSSSMEKICEETGAEPGDIRRWLREGRLILSNESAALLSCEGCGAAIRSGRYCDACTVSVKSRLSEAAGSMRPAAPPPKRPQSSTESKMHLDFRKK